MIGRLALWLGLLGGAVPVAAETFVVVISGLGGEASYSRSFHAWSSDLVESAVAAGVPARNVFYLAEDRKRDPDRIDGVSRQETVRETLAEVTRRAGPEDDVWVVLFGHGSDRAGETRVSLPGPDMSGRDFAEALEPMDVRHLVFVNATSASGGFVPLLSGPGRVVVTATRSAAERHAPLFGGFFAEGLAEGRADIDKDERVSLLEAFEYARAEVARAYASENQLQTEHALLDDNGDGSGSLEPELAEGADGILASRVFLAPPLDSGAATSPELSALVARREELEQRLAELRSQRESLAEELYYQELETLLVELARIGEKIRALSGGAEPEAPEGS